MSAVVGAYVPESGSLAWRVTAGGSTETVSAVVTAGREYWPVGDGRVDSASGDGDLFSTLEAALISHSAITTASVTLVQGRIRITTDVACDILWTDAATTAEAWPWGWPGAADTGSATTHDAPSTCPLVWLPGAELSDDTRDRQRLVTARAMSLSGLIYTADFGAAAKARSVSWRLIDQRRILEEYAGTDRTAWETLDRRAVSQGVRVRVYEDAATLAAGNGYATYRVAERPRVDRDSAYAYRWAVELELRAEGLDTRGDEALLWTTSTGAHVSISPGNYLSLANPSVLNGATALTISFWLRKGGAAVASRAVWLRRGSQLNLEERAGGVDAAFLLFSFAGEATVLPNSAWHHWVIAYSAGAITWYIDGAAVGDTPIGSTPTSLATVSDDLQIGGAGSPATATSFDMARLAFWVGSAASAAQASEIYSERGDIADGAGLSIGQPNIYMSLADAQVEGSTGGTATIVGAPTFVGA